MESVDTLVALQTTGLAGILGIIGWLIKRTFSHTLPRLTQDFKDSLEAHVALFRDELQKERDFFQAEIHGQREVFHAELKRQREEFREELHLQRDDLKTEIDKVVGKLDTLAETVREFSDGDRL